MKLLQIHEPGETPLPHEDAVAVGIDLGTTHSVVAVASGGRAEVIHDAQGRALLPSVVFYGDDGRIEAGYEARARFERGEKGAVASVKRLMGRGAADIGALRETLPYDLAPVSEQTGMVRLSIPGGRTVTPVEVSAEILRALHAVAQRALGREVTQAVITVPAYFDDAARAATRDAARLAGLTVLRLMNEPTAAALAYGLEKSEEGVYAVYDFGGGTFDVSLLKLEKGVFQVLATGGDAALGGDDLDMALAAWALAGRGEGAPVSSEQVGALVAAARKVKERLSMEENAEFSLHGKAIAVTRHMLERLMLPYIDRTLAVCERVLRDARLGVGDIHGVVLVGGSTRVPLVRSLVADFFGRAPLAGVNADEVVAVGAALQAEGLTQGSDTLLLDVTPLSIGLETMGGLTEKLIERNTPIPATASQEFTTWQDGQAGMQIHVVQGEREMVADNRSLARFDLLGIPPLPAGVARVKVTFDVDADGLLTVSAYEKTTGAGQSIAVKPSYGIAPEEMERMLVQSMECAREDIAARLLAEARMEAERAVIELESAMKQDPELVEDAERRLIVSQIGYLREAIAEGDRDRIDVEIQQLGRAAQAFAQRRMDRAVEVALKGRKPEDVTELCSPKHGSMNQ